MIILLFLVVPIILVTAYALYGWYRTREPSSVESGVDAFRREMSALSPDAAPSSRRPQPETPTAPEDTTRPERGPRTDPSAPPAGPGPNERRQPPRRPGAVGPEADR